jgi:hypothetical protein
MKNYFMDSMDFMVRPDFLIRVLLTVVYLSQVHVHGQGFIHFVNLVGAPPHSTVDAPVSFLDGTRISSGFTAQLYGGPGGTPLEALSPLFPTTSFVPSFPGYVRSVIVTVPDVPPGQSATFLMRVYDGENWEASLCRGESNPITLNLAIGSQPPTVPVGLQPFQVNCIPEPSVFVLVTVGAAVLLTYQRLAANQASGWAEDQARYLTGVWRTEFRRQALPLAKNLAEHGRSCRGGRFTPKMSFFPRVHDQ